MKLNVTTSFTFPVKKYREWKKAKNSPTNNEVKEKKRIFSYETELPIFKRSRKFPSDKLKISLCESTKSFERFGGIGIVFFFNLFRTLILFFLVASLLFGLFS